MINQENKHVINIWLFSDRLCDLWSDFLATDPEVPGSITGCARSLIGWGLERAQPSLVSINEELLEGKCSGPSLKNCH
jgi:hypothetical protein